MRFRQVLAAEHYFRDAARHVVSSSCSISFPDPAILDKKHPRRSLDPACMSDFSFRSDLMSVITGDKRILRIRGK